MLDTEIENRIAKIVERLGQLEHLSDPGWRAKRPKKQRKPCSDPIVLEARSAARRAYRAARNEGKTVLESHSVGGRARSRVLRGTNGVKDAA